MKISASFESNTQQHSVHCKNIFEFIFSATLAQQPKTKAQKEAELKKKADEERKQKEAEARKAKEEQRRVRFMYITVDTYGSRNVTSHPNLTVGRRRGNSQVRCEGHHHQPYRLLVHPAEQPVAWRGRRWRWWRRGSLRSRHMSGLGSRCHEPGCEGP